MGEDSNLTKGSSDQVAIRKAEIRADLLKWVVGSVALTLITTIGNWTFQYFSMQAEAEKTNRELKVKEKDMQLQYLDKFTSTAIDQDIRKRIRLAHYISRTIDDNEYKLLAKRWADFYAQLVEVCKGQLKAATLAGKTDVAQDLSDEPACTVGGTDILRPAAALPLQVDLPVSDLESGPGGILGELVARGESGPRGYNAYNQGSATDPTPPPIDFSKMSIAEITALQALPRGDAKRLFAIGKYFLIPPAMKNAIATLQLDRETKFTTALQERIFRNYLMDSKRPIIKAYITGNSDDIAAAQTALALEFASVARPDTGRSHYGGLGGAVATISAQETALALGKERATYKQFVSQGKTPDDAWNALSPGIAARSG